MWMEAQSVALTPYENFLYALKAEETKRQYPQRLDKFLTFMGLQGIIPEKCSKLYEYANENLDLLESNIIRFINYQRERIIKKELSEGTLHNYIKVLKLFLSMNDIFLNWKKIAKGLPAERQSSDDRIPTNDEINKLIKSPDRRLKPIVYVMISSGMRVGSWDYLKWKHVVPITDRANNTVIAARINLKNTKINFRDYYSFITPEAYYSLKDWMEFRQLHGEDINGDSWIMRDVWQKTDRDHGHRIGLAKYPKKLTSHAIRNIIYEAWKVQGIRDKLPNPETRRHEFKTTHSFRKYFETKCQKAKMNHNNIKILMDHSLGESQNYHRPTQEELLEDYLIAVDSLTVNEENRLKRKITHLQERQDEVALLKLSHEKEIQDVHVRLDKIVSMIQLNPKLANVKTEVLTEKCIEKGN